MKKIYSLSFLCLLGANTLWAQVPANIANKLNRTYDSLCAKLNIKGSAAAVLIPNMVFGNAVMAYLMRVCPLQTKCFLH